MKPLDFCLLLCVGCSNHATPPRQATPPDHTTPRQTARFSDREKRSAQLAAKRRNTHEKYADMTRIDVTTRAPLFVCEKTADPSGEQFRSQIFTVAGKDIVLCQCGSCQRWAAMQLFVMSAYADSSHDDSPLLSSVIAHADRDWTAAEWLKKERAAQANRANAWDEYREAIRATAKPND